MRPRVLAQMGPYAILETKPVRGGKAKYMISILSF
ncbi:hypothetical protein SAMN06265374_0183 [Roseibium denhamense]|uniref:Uncharacterized protein n=1 Tax=Roseibium denhamense TaxID=76305 RepID=A0ABY1N578_9HYPH|nr:hypothetical protein SAMN06265374_0183 [Roseibium denhamense]